MSNIEGGPGTDIGTSHFGGEKAKDDAKQQAMLPDGNANSTARDARDEDIVAEEFSGLDNDLVDIAQFDGGNDADRPLHAGDSEGTGNEPRERPDDPRDSDDDATKGGSSKTPGDMTPKDERGRSYPKTDGNPNVTGDVRSS